MEVALGTEFDTDYGSNGWWWHEDEANARFAPRAEVIEDAEGYHFSFDMAGLNPESVDVRVEEDRLVVEGMRTRPGLAKGARILRDERAYGRLHRAFELPDDASREGIRAAYKEGVLTVTMPKRPESKPVKIQVHHDN